MVLSVGKTERKTKVAEGISCGSTVLIFRNLVKSCVENVSYLGLVTLLSALAQHDSCACIDQAAAPKWNEKLTIPVLQTDTEILIRILNDNTMAKDDEIGRVV